MIGNCGDCKPALSESKPIYHFFFFQCEIQMSIRQGRARSVNIDCDLHIGICMLKVHYSYNMPKFSVGLPIALYSYGCILFVIYGTIIS